MQSTQARALMGVPMNARRGKATLRVTNSQGHAARVLACPSSSVLRREDGHPTRMES